MKCPHRVTSEQIDCRVLKRKTEKVNIRWWVESNNALWSCSGYRLPGYVDPCSYLFCTKKCCGMTFVLNVPVNIVICDYDRQSDFEKNNLIQLSLWSSLFSPNLPGIRWLFKMAIHVVCLSSSVRCIACHFNNVNSFLLENQTGIQIPSSSSVHMYTLRGSRPESDLRTKITLRAPSLHCALGCLRVPFFSWLLFAA